MAFASDTAFFVCECKVCPRHSYRLYHSSCFLSLHTTHLHAVSLILLSQSAHNTPTHYINHLAFVVLFPLVRQQGADDFTGVLNHHLTIVDVALAEQPSPMNPGSETHTHVQWATSQLLLRLVQNFVFHCHAACINEASRLAASLISLALTWLLPLLVLSTLPLLSPLLLVVASYLPCLPCSWLWPLPLWTTSNLTLKLFFLNKWPAMFSALNCYLPKLQVPVFF